MLWEYTGTHVGDCPAFIVRSKNGRFHFKTWASDHAACLSSLLSGCFDFSFTEDGDVAKAHKDGVEKALRMVRSSIDAALASLGKE